ncbi:uncharacterized protein N7498_005612 [Penicillium cinerascens]|uniref:GAT domain-containing protein n=1 Tax=Penicillium cinerascens TaxID=70096 RepID=A0A9W9MNX1_9EURO|nr:uncharacterized protein N7498_005612 [Penicillium cinerascens]KAJ5204733.1 hypothetical protein N7498_005612 [Penicillium cinerascens]
MKRFFKKPSSEESTPDHAEESPEGILLREMARAGAGPSGNEFVHLPRIVESAESSPAAAKEAASRIRRYLSTPASTPNQVQYNAIMLMRILVDNPGHSFTRNFDAKYVSTLKDLLRYGRDLHVQHYLRQYLDTLEDTKASDPDLQLLLQMWAKEKKRMTGNFNNQAPAAGYAPHLQGSFPPPPANSLPNAGELAARVEEARNSAKLLTQFVQTTPQAEIEENELIKEFVDRCRTSSRLIQSYIHSINPSPDEDTLLTLIEANDEISVAMSQQQRAMLKARKARGAMSPNSNVNTPSLTGSETVASPASRPASLEPAQRASRIPEQQSAPPVELPSIMPSTVMSGGRPNASRTNSERHEYSSTDFEVQNPFADNYATNDANEQRQHPLTSNPPQERVAFQPTEQGR